MESSGVRIDWEHEFQEKRKLDIQFWQFLGLVILIFMLGLTILASFAPYFRSFKIVAENTALGLICYVCLLSAIAFLAIKIYIQYLGTAVPESLSFSDEREFFVTRAMFTTSADLVAHLKLAESLETCLEHPLLRVSPFVQEALALSLENSKSGKLLTQFQAMYLQHNLHREYFALKKTVDTLETERHCHEAIAKMADLATA